MAEPRSFPQQALNQTGDGYEIIAWPTLNGDEANVTTGDTKAELTIPAGKEHVFIFPTTTDCIVKGGNTPVTIGANEGVIVKAGTVMGFMLRDIDTIAYIRSGDADGKMSYTFA